ncbi:MAG: glycosyltransferase family 2 protein [Thermodesulfobacteriota bacterium]
MHLSTITIGFVPRERFSVASECLQRIFDCTRIPFNLMVVDCNIPQVYRQQMEKVLSGRSNVKVIRTDYYLLPNQAKNLVIQESTDDFICFPENDVLVDEGWLSYLIAACEEHPADVAVPLILERHGGPVHFDHNLGHIKAVQQSDGLKIEIVPRSTPKELDRSASRRSTQFMENHCLLFHRKVFNCIGLYDEALNISEHIDLSIALHHAGVPVVFEPKCCVTFLPPPPIYPDERDYFYFRWDIELTSKSDDRIRQRWNLLNYPNSVHFAKGRHLIAEIAALIQPGERFIMVDQDQLSRYFRAYGAVPFLERDGIYWGPPPDAETAIREFERLLEAGATRIVFTWVAFWWLEFYTDFHKYLRSRYHCILENERLVVFDLRS